jgi:hypothetical protein
MSSAEVGRQALVGRVEFLPSCRRVAAALSPSEVIGEVFDMELYSGPISGEQAHGHPSFFPDHSSIDLTP